MDGVQITFLVINIVAVIAAPIAAVIIAQHLQNRQVKRKDKIEIFKTLVSTNAYGWGCHYRAFEAINSIPVIFADSEKVIKAYEDYINACQTDKDELTEKQRDAIKTAKVKLLEEMSKELNYKSEWQVFTKTYMPMGIAEDMMRKKQFEDIQLNSGAVLQPIVDMVMKQSQPQPQTEKRERKNNG